MINLYGIKLYETEELAKLLNVSKHTITVLRKKGLLRYTRLGNKTYTSEDALLSYLRGTTGRTPRKPGWQTGKGTDGGE